VIPGYEKMTHQRSSSKGFLAEDYSLLVRNMLFNRILNGYTSFKKYAESFRHELYALINLCDEG
jgi:hypothetical protein